MNCSSEKDRVDKTRTVGNGLSRGGAANRENKTTTTKAHSKCCQCQANRRCVRCQCVQEGRRCVDCYPGRNSPSTCANQSTALASVSQPAGYARNSTRKRVALPLASSQPVRADEVVRTESRVEAARRNNTPVFVSRSASSTTLRSTPVAECRAAAQTTVPSLVPATSQSTATEGQRSSSDEPAAQWDSSCISSQPVTST